MKICEGLQSVLFKRNTNFPTTVESENYNILKYIGINMNTKILCYYVYDCFFSNTQNVYQQQKLLEKRGNLEQIQATFSGNPDSFDMLINEGKAGLNLTSAADYNNKYYFNQAIASG